MMHAPAVIIAVAVLVEIIAAFPHASTLKAPTFLAVEDASVLLAGEIRQAPQNALKTKEPPIAVGIFMAILGSISGCAGVGMMYGFNQSRREAALMTGDGALEATATITSRKMYTTTTYAQDHTETQHHHEACYWFEAVRVDGMRCRISVTDRELGSEKLWECCSEGSRQKVSYLGDDPQHCRLTQAADNDKISGCGFILFLGTMLFGLVFAAAGFFVGVFFFTSARGLLGLLVCAPIWFGLVGCCMLSCVFPSINGSSTGVKGTSLEELGMQEPSSKLGDISGTWSLQSGMGTFEYKFAMENEKAFSLIVQGRPEGKEWDPEYQAHFTDGKTMNWQDNQGTAFTVTFEDAQKFGGWAKATNGSELAFVGFRQK